MWRRSNSAPELATTTDVQAPREWNDFAHSALVPSNRLRGSIRLVRRSSRYAIAPSGPDASLGQTRTLLAKDQELQIAHGFSKRGVVERNTGDPIEDRRLVVLQNYGWNDLAFRLTQRNCGEGVATDVLSARVHAALDKLGLDRQRAR